MRYDMPASHNPLNAYSADSVPAPDLANSPSLDQLIRDGKLYLSLKDAIRLALENNLDLAIARYNLPIAEHGYIAHPGRRNFSRRECRRGAGNSRRRRWRLRHRSSRSGSGWHDRRRRRSRCRRVRIGAVHLGHGHGSPSYDPAITGSVGAEHQTTPLANQQLYGVPSLQSNTGQASVTYSQSFPTGTTLNVEFNNSRQTTNSPFFNLSPVLNSMYRFSFQQQLLAGFGFGPNLRYLTIAKNNKKISDIAFKDQVIATITQIKNIYWDLVNAYEQAQGQRAVAGVCPAIAGQCRRNNFSSRAFRPWT